MRHEILQRFEVTYWLHIQGTRTEMRKILNDEVPFLVFSAHSNPRPIYLALRFISVAFKFEVLTFHLRLSPASDRL
jgi:hypothetical protein